MKQHLENLLQIALMKLKETDEVLAIPAFIQVEPTRDKRHGDYASNVAMVLAKSMQQKPQAIAAKIIAALPASMYVQKIEIAGKGFINFFLSAQALNDIVLRIFTEKEKFGSCKIGRNKSVLVEFISSNPTGPLHVGHGRHAAFGDVIANLLNTVGFKVSKEYYINDAGRQIDILTVSVWLRYLKLCGETILFPPNAYQGNYVIEIANALLVTQHKHFFVSEQTIFAGLSTETQTDERFIDALIERAKILLQDKYLAILNFVLENILTDIREDLTELGVHFDKWFSERALLTTGMVENVIARLKSQGLIYEKENALWFQSTKFGDEKDRVLIRSNGEMTYFANDIAYHLNKFDRGFDIAIDIWGADHHGYMARMKASIQALGIDPERLIFLLVQFVTLYRGKDQVQMSTRDGTFITLRTLRNEVGNDAARFFYVMRKYEQPMDFDLELAKAKSNENPIYYIQYAHARICSVFKLAQEKNINFNEESGLANLSLLLTESEKELLSTLTLYQDIIINAAIQYEPHLLANYLRELAGYFHAYYNAQQILIKDDLLRDARLALCVAVRQVLCNGLNILGIKALEKM